MRKVFLLALLLITGGTEKLQGQEQLNPLRDSQADREIPMPEGERIFVHYNTSLLFSGEYLYYKVYVLDERTQRLSGLSKIANVELIGEGGLVVFSQKIELTNGVGYGDFFIPTTLESGSYKIISYTQWMQNGGSKNYFNGDVAIINPYRGNQRGLAPNEDVPSAGEELSDLFSKPVTPKQISGDNSTVELTTSSKIYKTREKVFMELNTADSISGLGNYSISVRKLDPVKNPGRPTAYNYLDVYHGNPIRISDTLFLPELRGDLISGKIGLKEGQKGALVNNKKIALSITGEDDFVFKVSVTDAEGNFHFNLSDQYSGSQAFLQVIGEVPDIYQISLDAAGLMDYSSLDYSSFYIIPSMEEWIITRSVHNQVENAFYQAKPDTIMESQRRTPFYGEASEVYNLDDYNRFPTIRETFIEIIPSAWIVRASSSSPSFVVRRPVGSIQYKLPPLLLVDGVMVQDAKLFIDFPAELVETIEIIRDNYYLGPQVFEGLIIVKTKDASFLRQLPTHLDPIDIHKPQPKKSYFHQDYSGRSTEEHIPDFRYQLLWKPDIILRGNTSLSFFTSDIQGIYEIRVEGFTRDGEAITLIDTITVEN